MGGLDAGTIRVVRPTTAARDAGTGRGARDACAHAAAVFPSGEHSPGHVPDRARVPARWCCRRCARRHGGESDARRDPGAVRATRVSRQGGRVQQSADGVHRADLGGKPARTADGRCDDPQQRPGPGTRYRWADDRDLPVAVPGMATIAGRFGRRARLSALRRAAGPARLRRAAGRLPHRPERAVGGGRAQGAAPAPRHHHRTDQRLQRFRVRGSRGLLRFPAHPDVLVRTRLRRRRPDPRPSERLARRRSLRRDHFGSVDRTRPRHRGGPGTHGTCPARPSPRGIGSTRAGGAAVGSWGTNRRAGGIAGCRMDRTGSARDGDLRRAVRGVGRWDDPADRPARPAPGGESFRRQRCDRGDVRKSARRPLRLSGHTRGLGRGVRSRRSRLGSRA